MQSGTLCQRWASRFAIKYREWTKYRRSSTTDDLHSFHDRRLLIRRTLVVPVNDAVFVRVERPVLGVELLGRHVRSNPSLFGLKPTE